MEKELAICAWIKGKSEIASSSCRGAGELVSVAIVTGLSLTSSLGEVPIRSSPHVYNRVCCKIFFSNRIEKQVKGQ